MQSFTMLFFYPIMGKQRFKQTYSIVCLFNRRDESKGLATQDLGRERFGPHRSRVRVVFIGGGIADQHSTDVSRIQIKAPGIQSFFV